MAQLSNRQQLIDYIMRKLGYPLIQINVSEEQVNDRIDDAIEFNVDYNYNMMERKYLAIKISQNDIDNGYVNVPEEVIAVSKLLPFNSGTNSSNFIFDMQYHVTANALLNVYGTGDISQFYITKQYISTLNDIFINQPMYEFRRYTDKLYFQFNPTIKLNVDDYIVLECHTPIDSASRFWNDRLLRAYATALVKKQWASNISKYEEIQLPGGVKLNGEKLYNQANAEVQQLEEEIREYSEPIPMIIG